MNTSLLQRGFLVHKSSLQDLPCMHLHISRTITSSKAACGKDVDTGMTVELHQSETQGTPGSGHNQL